MGIVGGLSLVSRSRRGGASATGICQAGAQELQLVWAPPRPVTGCGGRAAGSAGGGAETAATVLPSPQDSTHHPHKRARTHTHTHTHTTQTSGFLLVLGLHLPSLKGFFFFSPCQNQARQYTHTDTHTYVLHTYVHTSNHSNG